jgi:hypothetical protein
MTTFFSKVYMLIVLLIVIKTVIWHTKHRRGAEVQLYACVTLALELIFWVLHRPEKAPGLVLISMRKRKYVATAEAGTADCPTRTEFLYRSR